MISRRHRASKLRLIACPLQGFHVQDLLLAGLFAADDNCTAWIDLAAADSPARMCVEQNREDAHLLDITFITDHAVRWSAAWTMTACHLGGSRPWLVCPAPGCGRRTLALYIERVNSGPCCRTCAGFTYPCQRESKEQRQFRKRARLIQVELRCTSAVPLGNRPQKPMWMQMIRYVQLLNELAAIDDELLRSIERGNERARQQLRDMHQRRG